MQLWKLLSLKSAEWAYRLKTQGRTNTAVWVQRPSPGGILSGSEEVESESEVAQSSLTLCNPMDCSLWGCSVHGICQARIPGWVAISFSRGSSWARDWIYVSHAAGRLFTIKATREVPQKRLVFSSTEVFSWVDEAHPHYGGNLP